MCSPGCCSCRNNSPGCSPARTMCARVCWPRLGFSAFDVNRTRCAALYVGLYMVSQVVLLAGQCALDVCWPSIGLCAFGVNRSRCAALYVGLYVQSRVVLLLGVWALDMYWPSLGLCALDVNRTHLYVQSRVVLLRQRISDYLGCAQSASGCLLPRGQLQQRYGDWCCYKRRSQ